MKPGEHSCSVTPQRGLGLLLDSVCAFAQLGSPSEIKCSTWTWKQTLECRCQSLVSRGSLISSIMWYDFDSTEPALSLVPKLVGSQTCKNTTLLVSFKHHIWVFDDCFDVTWQSKNEVLSALGKQIATADPAGLNYCVKLSGLFFPLNVC